MIALAPSPGRRDFSFLGQSPKPKGVIQGTDDADNFLLRPLAVFALSTEISGGTLDQLERVSYDGNINRGLVINGRDGDDRSRVANAERDE